MGDRIRKSQRGHEQVRFCLGDQGRDLAGLEGSCLEGDIIIATANLLLSMCGASCSKLFTYFIIMDIMSCILKLRPRDVKYITKVTALSMRSINRI